MEESPPSISYMRRLTSLSAETFMFSVHINKSEIARSLESLARQVITNYSDRSPSSQRKNYRSLIWIIGILIQLFESVIDLGTDRLSCTAVMCFDEFYILLYQATYLLHHCLKSSRLRLVLLNSMMSSYFHDLDREILCVLDVIPLKEMRLSDDVAELIGLLRSQLGRKRIFVNPKDESLKVKIFGFYGDLEAGKVPTHENLEKYFVQELGIVDNRSFRYEIESLEDLISNQTEEVGVPQESLKCFLALMKYSKLLIFGFKEEEMEIDDRNKTSRNTTSKLLSDTFVTMPMEFCCPISHDLMTDPVILATGHTFDRDSITEWFERGKFTCPVTRMQLPDHILIPNKAIQSLVSMWCDTQGTPCDPPPTPEEEYLFIRKKIYYTPEEERRDILANNSTRATLEVNRARAKLLLEIVSRGSESAKQFAVPEIQFLTENGMQLCLDIVSGGGATLLANELQSENHDVQEYATYSILNLSLPRENKIPILEVQGCIESLLEVARSGHTEQARDYAIATLHSLSINPENKKKLPKTRGLITTLVAYLNAGSIEGSENAILTLRSLSTVEENLDHLIKAGGAKALVQVLTLGGMAEVAADILADMVKRPQGATDIRKETSAVPLMTDMLRWGSTSEIRSAARALLEFFIHGGSRGMIRAARNSDFQILIPLLLRMWGVPEAMSKVAALLRVQERLAIDC